MSHMVILTSLKITQHHRNNKTDIWPLISRHIYLHGFRYCTLLMRRNPRYDSRPMLHVYWHWSRITLHGPPVSSFANKHCSCLTLLRVCCFLTVTLWSYVSYELRLRTSLYNNWRGNLCTPAVERLKSWTDARNGWSTGQLQVVICGRAKVVAVMLKGGWRNGSKKPSELPRIAESDNTRDTCTNDTAFISIRSQLLRKRICVPNRKCASCRPIAAKIDRTSFR